MLDISHEKKNENTNLSPDLIGSISEKGSKPGKISDQDASRIDTSSPYLPYFLLPDGENSDQSKKQPVEKRNSIAQILMPEEVNAVPVGESITIQDPELGAPINDKIQKALMKDADLYPPVHNKDGSTTYTLAQSGLTDRSSADNVVAYYSRIVNVTVPQDKASLEDCKYFFHPREIITKEKFDKMVERDKAASPDVTLYAHGVSTSDTSADRQALMLQLSNGRPTVDLDWNSSPVPGSNPVNSLKGYANDTIAAKRANDNDQFESAIDNTIEEVGPITRR